MQVLLNRPASCPCVQVVTQTLPSFSQCPLKLWPHLLLECSHTLHPTPSPMDSNLSEKFAYAIENILSMETVQFKNILIYEDKSLQIL